MKRFIMATSILGLAFLFASCAKKVSDDGEETTLSGKAAKLGRVPLDSSWYYTPEILEQSGKSSDGQTMRARMAVATETQCQEESGGAIRYDVPSLTTRCNSGDARACSDLGMAKLQAGDLSGAEQYQLQACQMGSALGCNRYAVRLLDRGDYATAEQVFIYLVQNGFAVSMANLGGLYLQQGKIEEGIQLSWQACNAGVGSGCNHIAQYAAHVGRYDLTYQFAAYGCQLGSCASCRTANQYQGSATN